MGESPGTLVVLSNPPATFDIGRGSTRVCLGGRSWEAEVDDADSCSLRLSITTCSDDSKEALAGVLAARSHEALQREIEAKALGAEIDRMMEHAREVCSCFVWTMMSDTARHYKKHTRACTHVCWLCLLCLLCWLCLVCLVVIVCVCGLLHWLCCCSIGGWQYVCVILDVMMRSVVCMDVEGAHSVLGEGCVRSDVIVVAGTIESGTQSHLGAKSNASNGLVSLSELAL
jgi:hypothetical protein